MTSQCNRVASTRLQPGAPRALLGVMGPLGESPRRAERWDCRGNRCTRCWPDAVARQAARRRHAIEADGCPARFALSLARKDAGLVADAVHDRGLGLA